jgi:hypothetical protein
MENHPAKRILSAKKSFCFQKKSCQQENHPFSRRTIPLAGESFHQQENHSVSRRTIPSAGEPSYYEENYPAGRSVLLSADGLFE